MRKVDRSNGYEALSAEFITRRSRSPVGAATVREWAERLAPGSRVLDVGCGNGIPISQALVDAGMIVHGVDASPSMIAAFRANFPEATSQVSAVEDYEFPREAFDAAVSWGLMFLLAPDVQAELIHGVFAALKPGGRFLFTAPSQIHEWEDVLTRRASVSLGHAKYASLLADAGFALEDETDDDHDNHYYFAVRKSS